RLVDRQGELDRPEGDPHGVAGSEGQLADGHDRVPERHAEPAGERRARDGQERQVPTRQGDQPHKGRSSLAHASCPTISGMTSLLCTERLHAGYGKIVAVRDFDLNIEEGEIVALLGANGAGKSTTLGAIAGLVDVKSGRVLLDNRD